jgi:NAD(P)-dependent dehydrogenase (short-subunit alcohol dehydrogenase family)
MPDPTQPLAIVTGASSGIGLELARLAAQQGYDLVIAADESEVHNVAGMLEANGAQVRAVEASDKGSINYPS